MLRKGHDIYIVTFSRSKKGVSHFQGAYWFFIEAISFSGKTFVQEFPFFIHFEDVIKQIKPDILHANNLPFLTSLQSVVIANKMQIPSVLHVHGVIGMRNKILDSAQYTFIRTVIRRAFHDATRVVCLTKSDALEVQKLGCPHEKIRIVPNGVDAEKFKPCEETVDNLIFWGGRFVPQKGLEHLIKALNLVAKEKPQVKLLLTGDGPLFSKIYCMAKNFGLEKNVIFKGRVARDELPALIGTASVCVLPSLKEGMPYALLEAMACGKAVVGSDISGINDVITHGVNGILVPPKNPKALADALIQLLEDKGLRRKLGWNARQLMVEKYSWQMIAEKIEKVYYEAINEAKF